MVFLAAGPDIRPIQDLILTWAHIGQALVGSIGALAFLAASLAKRGSFRASARLAQQRAY